MKPGKILMALCVASIGVLFSQAAWAITIDMVLVGDPGNAPDSFANSSVPGGTGAVFYNFNIGKYDVTLTQYCAFLNAVAASDPNNLYSSNMATDLNAAGISRSGSSSSYTYSVIGSGQRPVTNVSWYDAARFTNWLTNGQGSGGTETGVYTLTGPTSVAALPADHSALVGKGTKWFLPTESEWYKAAYYKGGNTNAYWAYPFQSDAQPTQNQMPGGSDSANFNNGVYATTQSHTLATSQNYLTDVGAYTSAFSPYGLFDMGGDVYQWNETMISESSRGFRGGAWGDSFIGLAAIYRANGPDPTFEVDSVGFRVASLPEPSSVVLGGLGLIGLLGFAVRRRRRTAP